MAGEETRTAAPPAPSPWRDRRFVIFAVGNLTNNVGDAIYAVALPLLVYELTGSLAVMSLLAALAPATLLCGPLLGAVADRFGARALVVPGLTMQLVAAFLLNLSATGVSAQLWALTLFGALIQIGGAAYRQGWMSGIPTMFPSNPVRARGTLGSLYVASTIIGPAIVGVGLNWLGYLGLLWLNLATFVAPIVVWWLGVHPPPPAPRSDTGGFRIHREVAEGWRIIRAHRRFFQCTMMVLPIDFVSSIGTLTLVTFYLRDRWHVPADDVGTIFTVVNVGALVGSVAVSERRHLRLRPLLTVCCLGMVACLFLMSLPVFPVLLVALVLFFTLDGGLAVAFDMLIIKYLPAHAIGRTAGISRLIHGIPVVAAPLTIPLMVSAMGATATFVVLALFGLVSVGWLFRLWALWQEDETLAPTARAEPVRSESPGEC